MFLKVLQIDIGYYLQPDDLELHCICEIKEMQTKERFDL